MRRREWLKAAAALAAPLVVPRHVLAASGRPGANDRILTGVIGCGARSAVLLEQSPSDIQIVALADCDLRQMGTESAFGRSVAGPFSDDFGKWRRYLGPDGSLQLIANAEGPIDDVCLDKPQRGLPVRLRRGDAEVTCNPLCRKLCPLS